ncbi:MAG: phosphonate ABC transporter substrate-binding protein [Deltaproteobacteria bacterium]|uniref:phosphonate ABC transporter substrate-binding protein n=1 Tax=Desulfosarcina sp. BuS5 TaxID=933262 RepID=UPI00047F44EA|nr:phosphonate ABC transporter substrate-binding protein [Desulfosarcina sp. BuS5]MCD6272085.1 phosphonate ABC transporter substrate-binding protein [Deltaproteobacteria bacterium]WDN89836.1 phosphonate transport system substrate-binding protein [Desulfosarcina sp. BuS5]
MRAKLILTVTLTLIVILGLSTVTMARTLVMGLIPVENNEEMVRQFEPMRIYLEKRIGMPIKVFTATDYTGVIEAMRKKRIDIAWFGPLSYFLAEEEAGAEAFAVGVRKSTGKSSYRSCFIVPADSTIKTLNDLKGKSVAFVDPASTSGGLVPAYLIKKETGKMPRNFFGKFTYAGSHDAVVMAVKNKTIDAGATNEITYNKMIKKGLITDKTNRILLFSDPLPGSPLAYRKDIDKDLKRKIRDAVLYAHYEIKVTGYGELIRYDAAAPPDYEIIRDLAKQLNLRKKDILK